MLWARAFGLATLVTLGLLAAAVRAEFRVERVVGGLNQPTYVTQAPGDSSSLYIVERQGPNFDAGRILKYDFASRTSNVFLDFAGNDFTADGGVLAMAFHPNFETNGKFYVTTSFNGGAHNLRNRVQEFRVGAGAPALQRTLLEYDNLLNPFHTVNWVGFDPTATGDARDYMIVTLGDGGTQANEPGFVNHSQDLSQVYGKILRIDVSDGLDAYPSDPDKNFGIPSSNPYAGDGNPNTLGEVYASGIREPFRASFDRLNGDFYFGDVGFNTYEEINFLKAGTSGQDYGWAKREGTIPAPTPHGGAQGESIDPIFQRHHNTGNFSFTGGIVYRGPVTELQGQYFFAEFVSGRLYSGVFDRNTNPSSFNGNNLANFRERTTEFEQLVTGGADIRNITAFGEDLAGNMYIVKFGNSFFPPNGQGEIFRIVPGSAITLGDLNFDSEIDEVDYALFLAGSYADLSQLDQDAAYQRGDLDGDLDNDHLDFRLFKQEYIAANGAGAWDSLATQVPEPSVVVLASVLIAISVARRGRRSLLRNFDI